MDPGLTVVLLGNTGVGKSASGNSILGRRAFESRQALTPVTKQISEATETVFGQQISVVDTPGILGSETEIQTWCQELLRSSRECLFLVVFSVGRFTKEQGKVLVAVQRVLGPQEFNKCYLLFTGGDALKDRSLEDFIFEDEETSTHRTTFSNRYHLFNNEAGGGEQVRELLMKSGHLRGQHYPSPAAGCMESVRVEEMRIVLLGLPGGGRSSSGNTILGSVQFESDCGFNAVSTETVSKSSQVEGRQVTVVDTQGISDEGLTPKQLVEETIEKASPGPHAFVIVVRLGSITSADIKLFETLKNLFDRDALKYSMVLFTHGDQLKDKSIEGLIRANRHVSELVSMCGGRYCVFDNKRRSREQVRNLLDKIDEMVSANGGQTYTDQMFRRAQTSRGYRAWANISRFLCRHKFIIGGIISLGLTVIVFAVRRNIQLSVTLHPDH